MIRVALDDGHGLETSGKRTPKFDDGTFMKENEFNSRVVEILKEELERHDIGVVLTAPKDADTPLRDRVEKANNENVDLFLSVHANAYKGIWGDWGGIETYTWGSGDSLKIGTILHKHLLKGTKIKDRGVKDGSWLYVIKNTSMPSVLVECGFMDNMHEAKLLMTEKYRRECAIELAMGICEAFGISYKQDQEKFKNGAILGDIKVELEQAITFIKEVNPNFNELIAKAFFTLSKDYEIRGDLALCQAILETDYFRSDLAKNQFNFGGIGKTSDLARGNVFNSIKNGVEVNLQHLFAYASNRSLPIGKAKIDPRFNLVKRESAKTFYELSGKWAMDENYGDKIINIYEKMKKTEYEKKDWKQKGLEYLINEYGLSDTWKKDDPIDFGILGTILERVDKKHKGEK